MSDPETCLGCARKVPDESGWKEQHAEHCSPDPSAIAARARAEAFEECARIAKDCADERRRQLAAGGRSERVNDALFGKLTEASRIEDLIRRRAKT